MANGRLWSARVAGALALCCISALAAACSSAAVRHPVAARIVGTMRGRVTVEGGWTLGAIDFLTVSEGYAVAENCVPGTTRCVGEVGATRDGGKTFSWQPLGRGAPQSVQFVNPQHGWALLGTDAAPQKLLATTDGGTRWQVVEVGQAFAGAPHFVTDAVGYAIAPGPGALGVMAPAGLLRSADGGRTWQPVATDGYYPADVDFLNAQQGYLTGWRCSKSGGPSGSCQGAILSTADGGQHWQVLQQIGQTETGNVGPFALDFLSPEIGFAALPNLQGNSMGGGLSALEGTTDGGRTWTPLQPAYWWGASIRAGWPSGPMFASPQLGWIALSPGAGPGAGGVLVTTDGGRSFHQFGAADYIAGSLDPVGSVAYAVVAPVPTGGWGSALAVIHPDGSVQQIYPSPMPSGGLSPAGGGALFGYGLPSDPAALLASRDGGRHWIVAGELPGRPDFVSFAGSQRGYAVIKNYPRGDQGYRTSDGGRTWRATGPVLSDVPIYARLFPGGVLVAVLQDGTVLRSTNTGRTWSAAGHMPHAIPWAVSFATPQTGLAYLGAGGSPALYETRDGGRRWRLLIRLPVTLRGEAPGQMLAIDADGFGLLRRYAWDGQYLITHDFGRTWQRLDLPQFGAAQALTVSGRSLALIATATNLYRSTDGGRSWRSIPSPFAR